MSVAVVNPLQLLRELFTVSGAGTLIRKGSRIERHADFDRHRSRRACAALLESAFGTPLNDGGVRCERPRDRARLPRGELPGRGAAVARPRSAPTCRKFAVERQAQGEGIGTDLWSVLTRDYPASSGGRAPPTRSPPGTPSSATACPLPRLARVLARAGPGSGRGGHRLRPRAAARFRAPAPIAD